MTILIVAGQIEERRNLERGLAAQNCAVETVKTGEEALKKLSVDDYDIIVLDTPLAPEVIRKTREMDISSGIIALLDSASRDQAADLIDAGADDCLVKPLRFDELSARIRALLRRERRPKPTQLKVGDLILDPASYTAWRAGREIHLSKMEYRLLHYLMRRAGSVCTRTMIAEHVWGRHFKPGSNLIEVYIWYLRKKIDKGHSPKLIHTVVDVGYKLEGKTTVRNTPKSKTALAKPGLNYLYGT